MVLNRVDFHLEVGIAIQQGRVTIPRTLQLLLEIPNLVLLGSYFGLKFLDLGLQLYVAAGLIVEALGEVAVLGAVLLLESLEVLELGLETLELIFELQELRLALCEVCLLVLDFHVFLVDDIV